MGSNKKTTVAYLVVVRHSDGEYGCAVYSGKRPTIEEIDETFDHDVQDMRISYAGRHPCDDEGNVEWKYLREHRTSSEYDIKRWDDERDFEDPGRKHGKIDKSRPMKIYYKRGDNSKYIIDDEAKYAKEKERVDKRKGQKKVDVYVVMAKVRRCPECDPNDPYSRLDEEIHQARLFTQRQPTLEEINRAFGDKHIDDMSIRYSGRHYPDELVGEDGDTYYPSPKSYIKYWDDDDENRYDGYIESTRGKSKPRKIYYKRGDKSKYIYDYRVGQEEATCQELPRPEGDDDKLPW